MRLKLSTSRIVIPHRRYPLVHTASLRYVGVGMPSKAEKNAAAAAAAAAEAVIGRDEGDPPAQNDIDNAAKIVAADRYGAAAGEGALRVADCNPVRTWAYLLGALPKVRRTCVYAGMWRYRGRVVRIHIRRSRV